MPLQLLHLVAQALQLPQRCINVHHAVIQLLRPGELLGQADHWGGDSGSIFNSSAIAVLAARRLREQGRTLYAYSFLDRRRPDIQLEDETEFVTAVLAQEGDIDWTPIPRRRTGPGLAPRRAKCWTPTR